MSFLSRIANLMTFSGGEEKAVFAPDNFFPSVTKSGKTATIGQALTVTAYYRAVIIIAETIAQLPVEIYRPREGGRGMEPDRENPLYYLFRHRPSDLQDAFQFIRTMVMHAVGTGNGIAYKTMVNGELRELIPIEPGMYLITYDQRTLQRIVEISFLDGTSERLPIERFLHISGPSWDVYGGMDPTKYGAEAIGLSLATEESHSQFHKNSARPSGILEADGGIGQDVIDRIKLMWTKVASGVSNVGNTPLLTNGIKWKSTRMTGVDAEHLDTRKHQIEEIARLLGTFPMMLGHAGDQSPTFASADAFLAAHVRFTAQPWIKAVKSAIETQILTKKDLMRGLEVKIDSSELMRGSPEQRAKLYQMALGSNNNPGWVAQNEVRQDDGWEPLDDPEADKLYRPMGAKETGAAGGAAKPAAAEPRDAEAKSSRPRSLYARRMLVNIADVRNWAISQGLKDIEAGLHVTIMYSTAQFDWMQLGPSWDDELVVAKGGPRVVERMNADGPIALKFTSSSLKWRHQEMIEAGAIHPYEDYQPHLTLTYNAEGVDLDAIEVYQGELRFGPELFSEIKE